MQCCIFIPFRQYLQPVTLHIYFHSRYAFPHYYVVIRLTRVSYRHYNVNNLCPGKHASTWWWHNVVTHSVDDNKVIMWLYIVVLRDWNGVIWYVMCTDIQAWVTFIQGGMTIQEIRVPPGSHIISPTAILSCGNNPVAVCACVRTLACVCVQQNMWDVGRGEVLLLKILQLLCCLCQNSIRCIMCVRVCVCVL